MRHLQLILFELMIMALADGAISDHEAQFLKIYMQHVGLDDEDFDEIFERAENLYRETQKTFTLIFE